mmetsp:Transcript_27618/g.84745  ORF Transcript_27618/g.84745 Transcript_27618/m.84745 type:complete len:376 (-) Transcript_27618:1298-2425(-)
MASTWRLLLLVLLWSSLAAGLHQTLPTQTRLTLADVGTQPIEWSSIGFEYRQTRSFLHYKFRNGKWDAGTEMDGANPFIQVHVGATALHYGQSLFEGLKAHAQRDGSVKLFRPWENAKRMQRGAHRTLMAAPDEELFVEACRRAVAANLDYVPPYGSGGALYVRPLLLGSGPRIGLQPADAYDFLVLVTPVGDYYKGSMSAVDACVVEDFDRAAPMGVGAVKLAGNYAPDLRPNVQAKQNGYPIGLYLDAKTKTFVEEFSTSNLFGIYDETYVTPDSDAILPSITNDSLMRIAEESLGLAVERRPVTFDELEHFSEVAACGTAVVVTPVGLLHRAPDRDFRYPAHPVSTQLYDFILQLQKGERSDDFGWMEDVLL